MTKTGAQAIVETLTNLGVQRVFALPGIQNVELFDALADAPFATVAPTNESSAVFMADGHARVTGALGVAVLTAGPGLTNALTAIAEAQLDSTPLLILVSSSESRRSFQLHQIPQEAMLKPLAKGWFAASSDKSIQQTLAEAAQLAIEREPGVVIVETTSTRLMERSHTTATVGQHVRSASSNSELDRIADRLRASPSVGIYAGAGAMNAANELRAIAELLQAPVATTISGRGIIPEDHPLSVGFGFGRSGTAAAWRAFRKIHTLLAIGCKYTEPATGAYGFKVPPEHIHIDINPASLGANYPASLAVVSDSRDALRHLLSFLSSDRRPVNTSLQNSIRNAREHAEAKALDATELAGSVKPSRFLRCLRRRLNRDAIFVTDCGTHQFWALNDFPIYEPRTFLAPADFQAMGFSIPAAISAKLARPERQVVSLVGDGGFLMSGFECLNAVRWAAKIIVIVFRDGAWGVIKDAQHRLYRRAPYTELPNCDFAPMAKGFGMNFVRIASDKETEDRLTDALSANGSVLVEVKVDYSESPPYVKSAGTQMFYSLPWRLQGSVAMRLGKRLLFPPT